MKIKLTHFLLSMALISFNCTKSHYSYKLKEEEFTVRVSERPGIFDFSEMESQQEALAAGQTRGAFTTFAGKGATIAAKIVMKMIEDDRKKYVHTYSNGASEIFCYDRLSSNGPYDPAGFQFGGITLVRTFREKSGTIDTAFIICLEVDNSDMYSVLNNSCFKMKVKSVDVRYAGSKVSDSRWYFPWTYYQHKKKDDKFNMDIVLTLTSTFVDEQGHMNTNSEFGKFVLPIRDLPLNPKAKNYQSTRNSYKGKYLEGKSFLAPRSYGYFMNGKGVLEHCYNQGIFNIAVSVTESGESKFGDRMILSGDDANK